MTEDFLVSSEISGDPSQPLLVHNSVVARQSWMFDSVTSPISAGSLTVSECCGCHVLITSHQPASPAPIQMPHLDLTISRLQVLEDLNNLISFAICFQVREFPFLAK